MPLLAPLPPLHAQIPLLSQPLFLQVTYPPIRFWPPQLVFAPLLQVLPWIQEVHSTYYSTYPLNKLNEFIRISILKSHILDISFSLKELNPFLPFIILLENSEPSDSLFFIPVSTCSRLSWYFFYSFLDFIFSCINIEDRVWHSGLDAFSFFILENRLDKGMSF